MADVLRSQRLEWLHARCLKTADEIPGARFFALRTDDELLNDTLNGRANPTTFPTSLFDFDWGDAARTLRLIAFEWKLAFPVATDISEIIEQFFDATFWQHGHDVDRDIEYLKDSGFWLPRWSSDADDHSDWTFSNPADHEAEVALKTASTRNLQKWAIEAFVSHATRLGVSLPNARYCHFSSVDFNGQSWIGVALDHRSLASDALRQQRLIELRLDQIGQDARNDLNDREWSIDVAIAMSTPSVWSFGPVSVCLIEENLFVAYARGLETLDKKVGGSAAATKPDDKDDECEKYVDPLSPRQKVIIRFLWTRKHATKFATLIDECWKKDVELTTVTRTLERIGECWSANNLCDISLNISKADWAVKLVKPDKSTDKKTDSTVG